MDSKAVGAKIIKLRREKGYTQANLAEKLNVSNKTVSRWETGDGFPEITILPKLAKEFGTTIDWLLRENEREENYTEINYIKLSNGRNLVLEFFTVLSIYEIACLCIEIIMALLAKNFEGAQGNILQVCTVAKILLYILLMVFSIVKCNHCRKNQQKNEMLLLSTWLFTFLAIGVYQTCIRFAWLGSLNKNEQAGDFSHIKNMFIILFATEVLRSIFICICGFVTKITLQTRSADRCFWGVVLLCITNICIQITMCFSNKYTCYGAIETSAICTAYVIGILFSLRRNKK